MRSDDVQPATSQSHDPAALHDDDTNAETSLNEPHTRASPYNLGRPHPSRTYSLDELLAETDVLNNHDTQQVLRRAGESVSRLLQDLDGVRTTLEQQLRPMVVTIAEIATKTFQFSDAWSHHVAQHLGALASVLRDLPTKIMRTEGPPNWSGLTDDELKAVIVTATSGIPVSWVPRTVILRNLLAADAGDRLAVLDAHAADIVDDCATAVSHTRTGTFSALASYTEEAILTYRAGQLIASQALSASLVDTLLRTTVLEATYKYYPKVKAKITGQPDCIPEVIACLPVLSALEDFQGHSNVPITFNRHASAHAVCAEQYTPTNALISLMLATSLLRQAHHSEHEMIKEDGAL
jgi:hypothetical protein